MSMSDVVTAVESGKRDLDDTTSIGSTQFCRVCLNDNYKTSCCQQVKNIATLIRTCNKNFSYRRTRQTRKSNEQPHQHEIYQQGWNRRDEWSRYSRNPSSSRNRTPSSSISKDVNRGARKYAKRSGFPPDKRPNTGSRYATRPSALLSSRPDSKNKISRVEWWAPAM